MKIYGYQDENSPAESVGPSEMMEITVVASPAELRKIAAFLLSSAKEMESMGHQFNHTHLADKQPGFEDSPHFIVFNPEAKD
jgi:hypothetical protein